jgi:hypothetical protein
VDNFVFSKSIEVSILEHRLLNLFELLEKANILYFFPSILFNETFWQLDHERKIVILAINQVDWVGDHPSQRTYFFRDPYFIDLMRTIKLTYFSYSKIDLNALVEVFSTKNKFAFSDFEPFGSEEESPLIQLNKIVEKINGEQEIERSAYASPTLAKIDAAKYYSKFLDEKEIKTLIINPIDMLEFWEAFFNSLTLVDQKQKTDVLKKSKFYFALNSQKEIEKLATILEGYPLTNKLFKKKQLICEEIDLVKYEPKKKYNYIFSNRAFNKLPTEILVKYGNSYFNVIGRPAYTKREDETKVIEKITNFQTPEEGKSLLTKEDLENIDFEVQFKEYTNTKVIELIEKNSSVRERLLFRFSVPLLTLLIKLIKSLKEDGIFEIWDHPETQFTRNTLALMRQENGEVHTLIDYKLYNSLLTSFTDIEIFTQIKSLSSVITEEVKDTKHIVLSLDKLISYLKHNQDFWREIFDLKNTVFLEDLNKITKSVKAFQYLKKKRVFLFGLPTLMYKTGFRQFKKKVLKHSKLKDFIDKKYINDNNISSYEKEIIIALVPFLYEKAERNKNITITNDINSDQNKEFYKFLEESGFSKEKVMEVITKNWDELMEFASFASNVKLFEITRMDSN